MNAPRFLTVSFFLLLATLALAAPFARAQTPPAVPAPKPATLRFLFLDETPGSYSMKSGATTRQISSTPYAISPPVVVQPGGRFEIFQTSPRPDPATGKKIQVKIASLVPPADLASALVVVRPLPPPAGETVPPPPEITYFDTSVAAFAPGSIRVINLGRAALGTQFDADAPFRLQPGQTRIVTPSPDDKNRIVVKIAVSEGDQWKLLSNKVTVLKPSQRMTGIFVYSPSGLIHTYTREELAEFGKPAPGHFWLTYSDTP